MTRPEYLLSVIVPVYNEKRFIAETLRRVFATPPAKEVIVVNDGSTDGSGEIIDWVAQEVLRRRPPLIKELKVIHQPKNQGKGAAVRAGLAAARGEVILIQDADLELDPTEYPKLLEPFGRGAEVVFGSRFKAGSRRLTVHFLGNRLLTWFSNWLSGLKLTDMETGYKVFKAEIIRSLPLVANRFGLEPELAARVARLVKRAGIKFEEVPVDYQPRGYAEGKKIKLKDGLMALWLIFYFNLCEEMIG